MCEMTDPDNATWRRLIVNKTLEPKKIFFHFDVFILISISELVLGLYLDRFFPEIEGIEMCLVSFFMTIFVFVMLFMVKHYSYIDKLKAFQQNVKKHQFRISDKCDFLGEIIRLAEIEEDDLKFFLEPRFFSDTDEELFCRAQLFYCGYLIASRNIFCCHYDPSYSSCVTLTDESRIIFLKEILGNLGKILEIKQKENKKKVGE